MMDIKQEQEWNPVYLEYLSVLWRFEHKKKTAEHFFF